MRDTATARHMAAKAKEGVERKGFNFSLKAAES